MIRYKCANCGFIFDWQTDLSGILPSCPKCGSNAVDIIGNLSAYPNERTK
jgi:predicted  nucleic acid-binding Zn-ribbon protein